MPLDLQYDILNDTPAAAGPVEANFTRTEQYINQELIARDGHVAMTGQLHLVGVPLADLDAAPKIYVDQVLPIGIVMMFGGAVPAGGRWLACDGTEYETAAFPELFAVIGVVFGGSSGHFRVPNFAGVFPRGTSTTVLAGSTGGSADSVGVGPHTHAIDHTHPLTASTNESVDHTHAGPSHTHKLAHSHTVSNHQHYFQPTAGASLVLSQTPGAGTLALPSTGGTNGWTHNTITDNPTSTLNTVTQSTDLTEGSGTQTTSGRSVPHTHNVSIPALAQQSGAPSVAGTDGNLPPYIGLVFAIRAK